MQFFLLLWTLAGYGLLAGYSPPFAAVAVAAIPIALLLPYNSGCRNSVITIKQNLHISD